MRYRKEFIMKPFERVDRLNALLDTFSRRNTMDLGELTRVISQLRTNR